MLSIVAVLCILVTLLYLNTRKRLNYWNERGVPNFNPKTPLGDLLQSIVRKENIHVFLKNVYHHFKAQGHRFAGIYLATGPIFVPIDYELIKRILVTDEEYFNTRGADIDRENIPLSDNLFSSGFEKWKYIREITMSELTPFKIKCFHASIATYARLLSEEVGKVKGPVDIWDFAQRFTLDVTSTSFYGLDEKNIVKATSPMIQVVKQVNTADIKDMFKIAYRYGLTNPCNLVLALFIKKESNEFLMDYATKLYNLRKSSKEHRNDALQAMIKRLDDENEQFDFNDYVSLVMICFLAAIETSSLTTTHFLYQLAVMPEVQNKLRNEILLTVQNNGGELNGDGITEMKYLDRVFWEVCRFHTTVPALNRLCVKDYMIPDSDVVIEKGTPVFIPCLGSHSDPDIFPDPEMFNPDRFLDPKQKNSLFTFGLGAKHCLGKKLGMHMVKSPVAEILKNYEVSVNKKTGDKLETALFSKHLVFKYKNTFWLDFKSIEGR